LKKIKNKKSMVIIRDEMKRTGRLYVSGKTRGRNFPPSGRKSSGRGRKQRGPYEIVLKSEERLNRMDQDR